MQDPRKYVILVATIFLLFCAIGTCGDDGDDDDNDNGGIYDDDDDTWPEDLPACSGFQEPDPWFEIKGFYGKATEFSQFFGWEVVSCTASLDEHLLTVACDGWSVLVIWKSDTVDIPIGDGETVGAIAKSSSAYDGTAELALINETGEIALYQSTTRSSATFEEHTINVETGLVCQYYDDAAQPPVHQDYSWHKVFGMATTGTIDGSYYSVEAGESILSYDDLYNVYSPVAWSGEVDVGEDTPTVETDGGYPADYLLQIVNVK
jgi:hypothetical protein